MRGGVSLVRREVTKPTLMFALFAAFLAASCGTQDTEETAARPEDIPTQIVESLVLRETESGLLRWVLWADRALRYEGQPTQLESMRIEFYDESGSAVQSTLTAHGGTVNEETRELLAQGDVVVVTSDGVRLESPELRWDPEVNKITTETPVQITEGENVLLGRGITSDIHLKSYVIHNDVRGTLRDEDGLIEQELR